MDVITIANWKGGTGKSTLAVHIAAGLARAYKVLLVDLDAQANATTWLQGLARTDGPGVAEVLLGAELRPTALPTVEWPSSKAKLQLLPATAALDGVDAALASKVGGVKMLDRALKRHAKLWDYVVIDTPPNLGQSTLNALCASKVVVAPILGAFLSLTGLRRLEEAVDDAREMMNVDTRVLGYVLFASDDRKSLTAETREALAKDAPGKLFKAEVRVSTAAERLPAARTTAWEPGEDPRGLEDYTKVLAELRKRMNADGKRKVA